MRRLLSERNGKVGVACTDPLRAGSAAVDADAVAVLLLDLAQL